MNIIFINLPYLVFKASQRCFLNFLSSFISSLDIQAERKNLLYLKLIIINFNNQHHHRHHPRPHFFLKRLVAITGARVLFVERIKIPFRLFFLGWEKFMNMRYSKNFNLNIFKFMFFPWDWLSFFFDEWVGGDENVFN